MKVMRFQLSFRLLIFLMLLFLGIGMKISSLNAQYFGRNKVQYETFNFKVIQTKHFDIYFYPLRGRLFVKEMILITTVIPRSSQDT